MKYLSNILVICGLLIFAYVVVNLIFAFAQIGGFAIFALFGSLGYLALGAIFVGIGIGLRDRLRAKLKVPDDKPSS